MAVEDRTNVVDLGLLSWSSACLFLEKTGLAESLNCPFPHILRTYFHLWKTMCIWDSIKSQEWWSRKNSLCISQTQFRKHDWPRSELESIRRHCLLRHPHTSISHLQKLPVYPLEQKRKLSTVWRWAHCQKVPWGVLATIHIPSTPLKTAKTLDTIYEWVKIACPLKGRLGYLFINLPISVGKPTIWTLSTF